MTERMTAETTAALAAQIRAAHAAVGQAVGHVLTAAMAAGDLLLQAQDSVPDGVWTRWLRENCFLGVRTARVYVRLARHREAIEAERQRAADLSLRAALRLIASQKQAEGPATKPKAATASLSSLAWSEASLAARRDFLDSIGLVPLLAAMPSAWQSEIERRVNGLRKTKAKAATLDELVVKALRQALSLQKAHRDKEAMAPGVAAALNIINNLLTKAGVDLNEIATITIDETLIKAGTKRAAA